MNIVEKSNHFFNDLTLQAQSGELLETSTKAKTKSSQSKFAAFTLAAGLVGAMSLMPVDQAQANTIIAATAIQNVSQASPLKGFDMQITDKNKDNNKNTSRLSVGSPIEALVGEDIYSVSKNCIVTQYLDSDPNQLNARNIIDKKSVSQNTHVKFRILHGPQVFQLECHSNNPDHPDKVTTYTKSIDGQTALEMTQQKHYNEKLLGSLGGLMIGGLGLLAALKLKKKSGMKV